MGGQFSSVLFVVDDLKQPLRTIVGAGILEAERRGFESVTLPMIRSGVMLGVYESTKEEALDDMVVAVWEFMASKPTNLQQISFVVYNDSYSNRYLKTALRPD